MRVSSRLALVAGVVACFASCTHITREVTPEERSAIQANFKQVIREFITEHEKKKVLELEVDHFAQLTDDEIAIGYHVVYDKPLEKGEKAHETFHSTLRLQKQADGAWHPMKLGPNELTLEFESGLQIRTTPVKPKRQGAGGDGPASGD